MHSNYVLTVLCSVQIMTCNVSHTTDDFSVLVSSELSDYIYVSWHTILP